MGGCFSNLCSYRVYSCLIGQSKSQGPTQGGGAYTGRHDSFIGTHYRNDLYTEPLPGLPDWGNILGSALWILPNSPYSPKGGELLKYMKGFPTDL